MDIIPIEYEVTMEALVAHAKVNTDITGAHSLHPVTITVAPNEAEERDVKNSSLELVTMTPHSNIFDKYPTLMTVWMGCIQRAQPKKILRKIWDHDKVSKEGGGKR